MESFYLLILCSILIGCQRSGQTELSPPNAKGVYALDGGVLTPLRDIRPAPDAEDLKYRTFSRATQFVVFEKWVADPKENINSIAILDAKSMGEHPMDEVDFIKKTVPGHPGDVHDCPKGTV